MEKEKLEHHNIWSREGLVLLAERYFNRPLVNKWQRRPLSPAYLAAHDAWEIWEYGGKIFTPFVRKTLEEIKNDRIERG